MAARSAGVPWKTRAPWIRKYTFQIFWQRALEIHGDKYDYTQTRPHHIDAGHLSRIYVRCNICDYEWSPTIASHIIARSGCPSCVGKAPWTLDRFMKVASRVHEDKFDYSAIMDRHFEHGAAAKIPVGCHTCGHQWSPSITDHINKIHGCPSCAGILPWTYDKFMAKVQELYGDRFDYSGVDRSHFGGNIHTELQFRCRECGYLITRTIASHIHSSGGCPSCSGKVPWTPQRFLIRARELHGEKFDYPGLLEGPFECGVMGRLRVECRKCHYRWHPTLNDHINGGYGCPGCAGLRPWTYERFVEETVNESRFDYSEVRPEHLGEGNKSNIPVRCSICDYGWYPTIDTHFLNKTCPRCSKKIRWTLPKFLSEAAAAHGDKFDYSAITDRTINQGARSHIPVTCRTCRYQWNPSIASHIALRAGCPGCSGNVRWSPTKFMLQAVQIHGDRYTYPQLDIEIIKGVKSKITLRCNQCHTIDQMTIAIHIGKKRGCRHCGVSPNEL